MDKKAQITIGTILVMFVAVLIGIALYIGTVQLLAPTINTLEYNSSGGAGDQVTFPADGVAIDLIGQDYISGIVVMNESIILNSGNYTISEGVSETTGVKTIQLTSADAADIYSAHLVNVSYVYGPDGYIESSGGRALASLIAVFAALAIAIIALTPVMKSGVLDLMGK